MVELDSNLKIIVGAPGIPLSYIIRENDAPDQTERDTWEEKAVLSVPLTGRLYKQDNLTLHNIILRNIADASHDQVDGGQWYIQDGKGGYWD